jgi:hypothetical protein
LANSIQITDARIRGEIDLPSKRLLIGLDAPKLIPIAVDGLLDRDARKVVRRSRLGSNDPDRVPRPKLIGQLAARRIAGEGSEASACI